MIVSLYLVIAIVLVAAALVIAALRSREAMSDGVKLQLAAVGVSVLLVALAMLAIVYTNQLPRDGDPTAYACAVTHNRLIDLAGSISIVQDLDRTKAPADASELWRWLVDQDKSLQHARFFDAERQTFVDLWDMPLRTVVINGELVGLASAGENRKWDDGESDDIVVSLNWHEERHRSR